MNLLSIDRHHARAIPRGSESIRTDAEKLNTGGVGCGRSPKQRAHTPPEDPLRGRALEPMDRRPPDSVCSKHE